MKSPVYFAGLRAHSDQESTILKVQRLFDRAGFPDIVAPHDRTALQLHFGELRNDGFISPVYVRQVVDKVKGCGGLPFLTDTNTLYAGSRSNAVDHISTATHFKGHIVSGFGGVIKNLAMGCAPPAGKREQHNALPFTLGENCIGCGRCIKVCPKSAILIISKKSIINRDLCAGCFECMHACPSRAIDIDWETEIPDFMERMVEYAYGAVKTKRGKVGYINFLIRITPDCDCFPFSDAPIVPDIGFLASQDPVAIDTASFDLVNRQQGFTDSLLSTHYRKGEDKFKGVHAQTDGIRQLEYAEKIGLGSRNYNLIDL